MISTSTRSIWSRRLAISSWQVAKASFWAFSAGLPQFQVLGGGRPEDLPWAGFSRNRRGPVGRRAEDLAQLGPPVAADHHPLAPSVLLIGRARCTRRGTASGRSGRRTSLDCRAPSGRLVSSPQCPWPGGGLVRSHPLSYSNYDQDGRSAKEEKAGGRPRFTRTVIRLFS